MKIVSFITLLIGVTAAADSSAAAASGSSEGNDSRRVGSVLHGFKNDVVQEQLNLHHHHHREQEDESDVRGALRGFKKDGGEAQKLWWENGGNSAPGQTPTGYWWHNPNAGGKNRDATGDYQLTKEALVKVAYYSKVAAAAATETASAASTFDTSAPDPIALMNALGDVVGNAEEAETYACLAETLVGTKSEDKLDGEDSSVNLLKGMQAIPGIARAIENLAKQTAQFAEMAIVAIDRTHRNVREVETATVATKTKAQTTKKVVEQLQMLMISNAGGSAPGQDVSLIDTAP